MASALIQSLLFCLRSEEGFVCSETRLVCSFGFFFYLLKAIALQALPHTRLLRQKMLSEHPSRYKKLQNTLNTIIYSVCTRPYPRALLPACAQFKPHNFLAPPLWDFLLVQVKSRGFK